MQAVGYDKASALQAVRLPTPEPHAGEVRGRIAFSGVNPADWKNRTRYAGTKLVVPNQDGSGTIDAVGPGVDNARIGQRVWVWEAARQRCGGTAQQCTVVPADHAVPLPRDVDL